MSYEGTNEHTFIFIFLLRIVIKILVSLDLYYRRLKSVKDLDT